MTRRIETPLDYNYRDFSISGLSRIRLAYSRNILQQQWKSETEIVTPVIFDTEDNQEHWIADWSKGDFTFAEFGIQEQTSENGTIEIYSLKAVFETGITQLAFKRWFDKSLRQQQICVVAVGSNGKERAFNPFEVNYRYISSGIESETNRYELTFVKTRLLETFPDDYILGTIQTAGINEALTLKADFLSNKAINYWTGLSKINSIDGVESWISGEQEFQHVPDGDYFLFAKHKDEATEIVLSTPVKVDHYVAILSFKGWKEFYEENLTFEKWVEITDYEVSEAEIVTGINI